MQHWYNLSDEGMEDALHEITSMMGQALEASMSSSTVCSNWLFYLTMY